MCNLEKNPLLKEIKFTGTKQIDEITGGEFYFNCTACGDCCRGGGNVYFSDEELQNLKEYLNLDAEKWKLLVKKLINFRKNRLHVHSSSKACIFIGSENRCRIYPVRPLQCRSYPYWPSVFESKAELLSHMKKCPGFNEKISPISSLQIARRVNSTVRLFNSQQSHPEDPIKL